MIFGDDFAFHPNVDRRVVGACGLARVINELFEKEALMVLLSLVPGKFAIQKEFVPDTNAPNRTTRALSAHTVVGADETRQVSPIAPNERWPYAKYRVNAISATSPSRLGSSGYSLL
jgi:hypothetical protein